ncbi:MAG: coenzyme F420-0:L-glutamate ligase [Candidatus Bathyarchaeia archaeon]
MKLDVFGLEGIPRVEPGADLPDLLFKAAKQQDLEFRDKDIVVVTQKIVSKAEGRVVRLEDVSPSSFAKHIARYMDKDPRIIEVVLSEANRIIKMSRNAIIVETKHGFTCANAGVDYSNVEEGQVSLLPLEPDESAKRIRQRLEELTEKELAVVVTDTWGRPWRLGQVDFAIGVSGISPFRDYRGEEDMMGHELKVTNIAVADEIAAMAELVKGKSTGVPVVIVRGYDYKDRGGCAEDMIRPVEEDLFR